MEIGDVLGMLGGAPHMVPKSVFVEKIKGSKALSVRIDSDLAAIIAAGPSGLQQFFQNPLAQISTQLNAVAAQAATTITAKLGDNPFSTALATLQTKVTALATHANELSGATMSGTFNFLNVVSHMNIAEVGGAAIPAALGLDKAVGPLLSSGSLTAIKGAVDTLTDSILRGQITATSAAAIIDDHSDVVTALKDDSVTALTGLPPLAPTIAMVSSAAALIMTTNCKYSEDTQMAGVMQAVVQPDMMVKMKALEGEMFPPNPPMIPEES